ncbi:TPA: hypothetical protein ACH3X2_008238 [Trebouxia sp. C0005]
MGPPPPRQTVPEGPLPPPSPPLPGMFAGQVSSSALQLSGPSGQAGRSTGAVAPAPPPPPPVKSGGGVRAPPPPPPPPPPGGLSQLRGQPARAPAPPSPSTQQDSEVLQVSAAGTNKPNARVAARPPGGNGGVVLSIAEQAAQMAARRVKPPTVPVAAIQASSPTVAGPAGPVSFRDGANVVTASAAHKHAPSDAYELEDLDEDWVAMLNVLDNKLLEARLHELNYTLVGRPTMMAKERAVAVRSLLVSTGRDKPDVALQNAIEDIERYRRIH